MEIKGKITHVLETQTGEGQKGTWVKQNYVLIETEGSYPKLIAFDAFNKDFNLKVGDIVNVSINIESREYKDKWYTNISAWKVDVIGNDANIPEQKISAPPPPDDYDGGINDLPF